MATKYRTILLPNDDDKGISGRCLTGECEAPTARAAAERTFLSHLENWRDAVCLVVEDGPMSPFTHAFRYEAPAPTVVPA